MSAQSHQIHANPPWQKSGGKTQKKESHMFHITLTTTNTILGILTGAARVSS